MYSISTQFETQKFMRHDFAIYLQSFLEFVTEFAVFLFCHTYKYICIFCMLLLLLFYSLIHIFSVFDSLGLFHCLPHFYRSRHAFILRHFAVPYVLRTSLWFFFRRHNFEHEFFWLDSSRSQMCSRLSKHGSIKRFCDQISTACKFNFMSEHCQ